MPDKKCVTCGHTKAEHTGPDGICGIKTATEFCDCVGYVAEEQTMAKADEKITKDEEKAALADESAKAAAEQDKADAPAEEPKGEGPSGWYHDVDHDSNLARQAAQHARDISAGAPNDREDNVKSRPGRRPK